MFRQWMKSVVRKTSPQPVLGDVVADVEEIRTRRYFGGSRGVRQCDHTEQCEDRNDGRHQSAARALTGALSTNVHFR